MKLSSYVNQINQSLVEMPSGEGASALEQGLKNGMEAILGKQSGESITGEVLQRSGSDILLSMGNNQLLQAKLEGNMSALPGQLLTFQIKNNGGGKVVLSPLFENMSQDPNISKALRQAGLPETGTTMQMVKSMMEEGLPIDKQSLYQMNRLISLNPQADITTLVQMQRLSLPITPENIFQFEAYKNYQHQILGGLEDITDALTQTFQEITGEGNLQEGLQFYRDILSIFTNETDMGVAQLEGENIDIFNSEAVQAGESEIVNTEMQNATEEASLVEKAPGKTFLGKEIMEWTQDLQKAGASESFIKAMQSGEVSGKDILNEVSRLLSDETIPDKTPLFSLIEGKSFKQLLKNEMSNQWLLKPEEVAKEQSVDKLYEKLNSQMNQLGKILSQTAGTETSLAKTVSNVTSNIDFMNQLNQMFTYVQIPLKMEQQRANGELFVYTNKKSLAKEDGSVSALLHLEMENLGSVDVHVTLNEQKVATKFYLQDDSSLDLIADNIELLNNRLEKRGYSMSAEFINKENEVNVMDEILSQNKSVSVLAGYSFDARA